MTKRKLISALFATLFVINISCSKDKPEETIEMPKLELEESRLTFSRIGSVQTVGVATNQSEITCSSGVSWCNADYADGLLTIETITNQQSSKRTAIVSVKAGDISKSITISQLGLDSYADDIKDDIRVLVSSAETSSYQSGTNIDKSIDGDYTTIYHSKWDNSASDYFPITMTYKFSNISTIDYFVYYPRQDGTNGHIKEFELWVATEANPTLVKYDDYDFGGSSTSTRVSFSSALIKPTAIQLKVKSGAGDAQGFVSCAEMEFYQKNPENFDYLSIFTDNSCSELKAGITESSINSISNNFFKDLALEILHDNYDKEFRVQEYKVFQNPNVMASVNKTSPYSMRDNPTGIYVSTGEELVFFANNPQGENVSILIQDLANGYGGNTYPVADGLNKINVTSGGLVYVMYYTVTATEAPITINFATGSINGYFDSQKHTTEDWTRLINAASVSKHFDVLGKFAHMTFPTAKFRENTPDGLALINKYDDLVRLEMEFMGLYKYDKVFKNRMYFHVVYTDSYMYATSYRTAYAEGTMDFMTSLQEFSTSPWGPAHEVGHCNQTRPGLKWLGMTEVTNNIHSLHVQTAWGNESRLLADKYANAIKEIVEGKIAHNASSDVFNQLVPFWQLKLYLMDALGKSDFYKDLYEYMRNQDTSLATGQGYYQLDFVRACCRIANLDLTEFFEQWGFLTAIDSTISDYTTGTFIITQAEIDALKAEIAAANYPKPKHSNIYLITDDTVSSYK